MRFAYVLIGFGGGLLGLWLLVHGALDLLEAKQSASWPKARGVIVESSLKVSHGRHGSSDWPMIQYTYSAWDHVYTGTTLLPGCTAWSGKATQQAFQAFPKGATVSVPYLPSDPTRSVLMPGLHAANGTLLMLGLLATTFTTPFALTAVFGVPDPAGKPGTIRLSDGTLASSIMGWCILSLFVEFGFLWWLL